MTIIDNNITSTRKFGLRDKLGYMFGDLANDFMFILGSAFLMVFYTDIFGINPAIIGTLFMVARLWDAFMDVVAGRFVDSRPNTEKGKFKLLVIRCAPIYLIFSVLMFTKIPGMSNQFYLVYAFATYIIWGSLYSFVVIPYGSMASVITNDSVERASLSTFRNIGASVAATAVTAVVPMVVFVNNKPDGNRFFIITVLLAVIAMICYALFYKLSIERTIIVKPAEKKGNIGASLKALVKNRPFIVLVSASLVLVIAMLLSGSLNNYLYKDYFENTKALSLAGLVTVLNVIVVAPAVAPISKKFGKKESASVALLFSAIAYFLLYLFPTKNAFLFVGLNFIANLGYMLFNFMLWAFVTDVIDYQEYRTEVREDGTVYSIYSFARKIGQALAGAVGGVALQAAGYVAKAPQQTAEVASNIRNLSTLIPAVAYFIVFLILAFGYPMTKEALTEIQAELERRRTGQN